MLQAKSRVFSAEFVKSAVCLHECPKDNLLEIALFGKSNVGKSSLINTIAGKRALARTSSEPGKTRTINFYRINNAFYLVDLPGYGYARASSADRRSWSAMVEGYVEQRENLRAGVIILDIRREPEELEAMLYKWLSSRCVTVVTALTKIDKLSRNAIVKNEGMIRKTLSLDDPFLFSSVTGEGRTALLKRFFELV
ncbi:MAG: YihA family ribosome biogenesis GTP-binding protein [Deltaproteobacteria bacterium]|nr:YihA family ribosome biogenesis GTP-binding protein [Deltaproteobacteria bacterium]